jgi:hypothetical protein
MKIRFLITILVLVFIFTGTVFAQGVQTATLEGTVNGPDGKPLPGVTVTVKSPGLMGERQAVTSTTGDYNIPGLPPGDYTITFSLEGMQPQTRKMNLVLGLPSRMDAQMKVTAVAEAITVTASSPAVLENTTVGANIKAETVQQLPIPRTPIDIGALSPGVTGDRGGRATTPVANQLSINGGLAYDNNILINGVNMQDNIFGNPNNLFIEDAVQETQVLTSGISAEYGHFTGGVLNVITKSGGNTFTASLRDDLTKAAWLSLTPFEEGFRGNGVANAAKAPHVGKISNVYEGTLGGPILRDHLWFFVAGRKEQSTVPNNFPVTGGAYSVVTTNKRPEGKLTGTIGSHTLQADYIDNPVKRNNEVQVTPLEIQAVGHNSTRPNYGYTGNYSGVLTSQLFAEARYSRKLFGFRGVGGTATDILSSPIRTSSTRFPGITIAGTYNAPYFDATDPEDRANKQWFGALSYFLSKPGWGSHDIKGGYERFIDIRTGGNSQSATGYSFTAAYKQVGGVPVLDSAGRLFPVFTPKTAGKSDESRIAWWLATRGAELDTTTDSVFVNDRWNLNQFFTFNLGLRHESVKSKATGGIVPISSSATTPRLGASYDVLGNGKYKVDVTYAQYAGRYNPALVGATTPVGNPAGIYGYYTGPAGEGRDFAPGFNPNNYHFYNANVPTANVFTDKGMHSPTANEWTLSGGMALPRGGWAKATLTNRKYTDFIEDFILLNQGCTNIAIQGVNLGCVDNVNYKNSNQPKRNYQAVELQSHYDITRTWGVEGNWSHQFKNNGNYEGESGQSLPTSQVGNRPEMQDPREITTGRLAQFEADRLRLWTTYTLGFGRFGNLSTGLLYRYDSPLTFTYNTAIARSAESKAANPGYHNAPPTATILFGDRGAGEFNSTSLFDASLQYSFPIVRVTPWVKFDVRNVFNDHTLVSYNTSVTADPNSPKDSFGYATGFTKNVTFGRPTNANSYVRPREYLVYVGVRY